MNCPTCGQQVPEGCELCPFCSKTIPLQETPPMPADENAAFEVTGAGNEAFAPPADAFVPSRESPPQSSIPTVEQEGVPLSVPIYQTQYGTYTADGQGKAHQPRHIDFSDAAADLLKAFGRLPSNVLKSVKAPGDLLVSLMQESHYTDFGAVVFSVLLLTFLCGMLISRGVAILGEGRLMALFTGYPAANFYRQIGSLSWRMAAGSGAIAVLLQLLIMLIGSGVPLGYLCLARKHPFTLQLMLSWVTVLTLPTLPLSLLTAVLSLSSPWPPLVLVIAGTAFSQCQTALLLNGLQPVKTADDSLQRALVCVIAVALIALVGALLGGSIGISRLGALWENCTSTMLVIGQ